MHRCFKLWMLFDRLEKSKPHWSGVHFRLLFTLHQNSFKRRGFHYSTSFTCAPLNSLAMDSIAWSISGEDPVELAEKFQRHIQVQDKENLSDTKIVLTEFVKIFYFTLQWNFQNWKFTRVLSHSLFKRSSLHSHHGLQSNMGLGNEKAALRLSQQYLAFPLSDLSHQQAMVLWQTVRL